MSEWMVAQNINFENAKNIKGTDYFYYYDQGEKFLKDKVVIDDDGIFLILDGVIFNKRELMEQVQESDWACTIKNIYKKQGIGVLEQLRGSFNGFILEKKNENVFAFVDQLGERTVFYCYLQQSFIAASNFNRLVELLRKRDVSYTLDKEAIRQMLYFGYMVDKRSCISEITRIFPGTYIEKDKSNITEEIYFQFENHNTLDKNEDELIELIDQTFIKALKRELDKDKEYGYKSLMDISGGMDARTVCFATKKLGYRGITNICYSQMNAYERQITEKMVTVLGNDYIFKSLDNASFIYHLDELVRENYGLSYFMGITGGRDFLKILDKHEFGIEHTGILGDVYEGSFNSKAIYEKPYINPKYRFSRLLDIDLDMEFIRRYDDNEIFKFYTRGVMAGTSTHIIRQKYFETYSPFEDVDFLKLMFAIPLKQRIDGKIFMKWVNKKYPEAMKFTYAGTMCNPNSCLLKTKLRAMWNVFLLKVIIPVRKKYFYDSEWNYKGTMNPVEYWYEKNSELRTFIEAYYQDNIEKVKDLEIKENLEKLFYNGSALDKMVMLTVLSIYKQYGDEK